MSVNFNFVGKRIKEERENKSYTQCKITVLETKVFPELQEQYLADPKSGPSDIASTVLGSVGIVREKGTP